jgi:hypothetical protein
LALPEAKAALAQRFIWKLTKVTKVIPAPQALLGRKALLVHQAQLARRSILKLTKVIKAILGHQALLARKAYQVKQVTKALLALPFI